MHRELDEIIILSYAYVNDIVNILMQEYRLFGPLDLVHDQNIRCEGTTYIIIWNPSDVTHWRNSNTISFQVYLVLLNDYETNFLVLKSSGRTPTVLLKPNIYGSRDINTAEDRVSVVWWPITALTIRASINPWAVTIFYITTSVLGSSNTIRDICIQLHIRIYKVLTSCCGTSPFWSYRL